MKNHQLLVCIFVALLLPLVVRESHAQEYVVEVLVVVDKHSTERWEAQALPAGNTVDQEMRGIMYEVNRVFRRLQTSGIDIAIRLFNNKVFYLDRSLVSRARLALGVYLDSNLALDTFRLWASEHPFDVALYVSGYDFSDQAIGRAELGSACECGIAVVGPYYDTSQVQNIAHEIGHVLGLMHDGEENDCNGADGFVMRERGSTLDANAHTWSRCSIEALKELLKGWDCLKQGHSVDIVSPRLGQLIPPDEACRRYNGKHVSRYSYFGRNYGNICRSLTCEDSLSFVTDKEFRATGVAIRTPEGMQCGPGHSCDEGQCVPDSSAPLTWHSQCPFGDTPTFASLDGLSACREARDRGKCAFFDWTDICCDSCR